MTSIFGRLFGVTTLAVLFLGGCTGLSPYFEGADDISQRPNSARQVDLFQLLADGPNGPPQRCTSGALPQTKEHWFNVSRDHSLDTAGADCLALVEKIFYANSTNQEFRRNRIQDALRAASVLQCKDFLDDLNGLQSAINLQTGTLATALAGAGAIVTSQDAARILSGSAAVVTGGRAEFNADVFFQKTVSAIKKAIDQKRAQDELAMNANSTSDIKDYTLERAMADAFKYNADCSLVSGLAQLDEALVLANDPGLKEVYNVLVRQNAARAIVSGNVVDSKAINPDGTVNPSALTPFGAAIPPTGQSPSVALAAASESVTLSLTAVARKIDGTPPVFAPNFGPASAALRQYITSFNAKASVCQASADKASVTVAEAKAAIPDSKSPSYNSMLYQYSAAKVTSDGMSSITSQAAQRISDRATNDAKALDAALDAYHSDNAQSANVDTALTQFVTDFPGTLMATDDPCP